MEPQHRFRVRQLCVGRSEDSQVCQVRARRVRLAERGVAPATIGSIFALLRAMLADAAAVFASPGH
jgi:hypothetical protein